MKIHFIGIGGIGVSGLAQYYLAKGHEVSGSDLVRTEIIDLLERKGTTIFIGPHKAEHLPENLDVVIYSSAVRQNNPELKKALDLQPGSKSCDRRILNQVETGKLRVLSYPQALGKLTKKHFTIAVSGTHGKSTTTAMISLILIKAGLDPIVIIGTKLKEFGNSNFRTGQGKYLVIEADEWQASFLNYWPKIIVLTNIEKEHLDYYKSMEHVLETYSKYIRHLPKDGILVMNKEDKNCNKIVRPHDFVTKRIETFSLEQGDAEKIREILKIPGEHNAVNAVAALTTARALNIPDEISFQALSEYKGSWRRFEELKIVNCKLKIISDYAHHPTEIAATLKAAKERFRGKKIWCIFQPHQYQRTFYLFENFVRVFQNIPLQKIIITDIYDVAGREDKEIKEKVNAKKLVEAIGKKGVVYLPKNQIVGYLKKNLRGREVVIIMGAGDIYRIIEQL